jgi:hypothetical protein
MSVEQVQPFLLFHCALHSWCSVHSIEWLECDAGGVGSVNEVIEVIDEGRGLYWRREKGGGEEDVKQAQDSG